MAENNIEQGEVVDDDDENEALKEIVNNEWMRGLEDCHQNRCKVALELWKEKDKLFTDRIDRKKQSLDSQNEVYQLIGFYVVFQGVLLTAVAQSSLLHCNNTWTAALLSALAFFVTVIGVTLKLGSVKELERTIGQEENTRSTLVTWQLQLWEDGEKFNFVECTKTDSNQEKKVERVKNTVVAHCNFPSSASRPDHLLLCVRGLDSADSVQPWT